MLPSGRTILTRRKFSTYPVGQKLHPLNFLNNSVKPRFMSIIFGTLNTFHILRIYHILVDSSTGNQLNNLFVYTVADNNINYLRKFIMLYSKENWIDFIT